METFYGIMIPFLGTSLGAAWVFLMRRGMGARVGHALVGFAAGVMVAASVWSLIIPAVEESLWMGTWSFVPAATGFLAGIAFLMLLNRLIPIINKRAEEDGSRRGMGHTFMTVLAVTLHNIPEGMAVGAVYAGYLAGGGEISAAGALALSVGIAIQNFPEGAIVSMPLHASGKSRARAFLGGVLSGAVEPVAAVLTLLLSSVIIPVLPYLLAFAAGAMLYVVVRELIPEMYGEDCPETGTVLFAVGFTLMMILDIVFS